MAGLRGVTLTQLLSHTGGLPTDNEVFDRLLGQSYLQPGNLDALRYWLVRQWSTQPLASPPGSRFAYSNMGYTMVGAAPSAPPAAPGKSWSSPGSSARSAWPRRLRPRGAARPGGCALGHQIKPDGTPEPMLAGPNGDNPLIIGPAGTVHLSVLDFAAWAGWHAGEGKRGPALVKPETLRRLHTQVIAMAPRPDAAPGTPGRGGYALGWGVLSHPWSSEPFLQHAGSNTLNLALVLVQPTRDFAMVMMTNIAGKRADAALNALAEAIYRQYGPARA